MYLVIKYMFVIMKRVPREIELRTSVDFSMEQNGYSNPMYSSRTQESDVERNVKEPVTTIEISVGVNELADDLEYTLYTSIAPNPITIRTNKTLLSFTARESPVSIKIRTLKNFNRD